VIIKTAVNEIWLIDWLVYGTFKVICNYIFVQLYSTVDNTNQM